MDRYGLQKVKPFMFPDTFTNRGLLPPDPPIDTDTTTSHDRLSSDDETGGDSDREEIEN
jgi:hypothetical protein